jgi:hypothetical protein
MGSNQPLSPLPAAWPVKDWKPSNPVEVPNPQPDPTIRGGGIPATNALYGDSVSRYSNPLDDYYTGAQSLAADNKRPLSPFEYWWISRNPKDKDAKNAPLSAEQEYHKNFERTPEFQMMDHIYRTIRGLGTSSDSMAKNPTPGNNTPTKTGDPNQDPSLQLPPTIKSYY